MITEEQIIDILQSCNLDSSTHTPVQVARIIQNLYSKENWISCEDRLPEDHSRYLCMAYLVNCYVEAVCLFDKVEKAWMYERNYIKVSHWQPLPSPPSKDRGIVINDTYLYCPACKAEIDAKQVTFDELHDTCGTPVEIKSINDSAEKEETGLKPLLHPCLCVGCQVCGAIFMGASLKKEYNKDPESNIELLEQLEDYAKKGYSVSFKEANEFKFNLCEHVQAVNNLNK